jgi:hypothetical protein
MAKGAPASSAASADTVPRIDSIRPDSVIVPRGAVVEVVIRGRGFVPGPPGMNTIHFAGSRVPSVPANAAGTELRFAIPDALPSGSEAPPMPVETGAYAISVETVRGVSNPMTIRIFR